MARVESTDLILTFTPTSSTIPTSDTCDKIITMLYKEAFEVRNAEYTESEDAIIDSEEVFAIIQSEASKIVEAISRSVHSGPEGQPAYPNISLSRDARRRIKSITRKSVGLTSTVRLWNEDENW